MTLDVKGGLKNTGISRNRYVVIEELVSNAIDSYLIRRHKEHDTPSLSISLLIETHEVTMFKDGHDVTISCEDNGAGFDTDQIQAFVTKDSTFKDNLDITGLSKCKGVGRIQFFHFFRNLNINSAFVSEGSTVGRTLNVSDGVKKIAESDFIKTENPNGTIKTLVTVGLLTQTAYDKHFDERSVKIDFSAQVIRDYLFVAFLQKFIVLKTIIGDFSIVISDGSDTLEIRAEDLPDPVSVDNVNLICVHDGGDKKPRHVLRVTRYSIPKTDYSELEHEVALCANSALVHSLTDAYLRAKPERTKTIDGNFELVLVEGEFLEENVNDQRDGFNIPADCSLNEDLFENISLSDIVNSLEDYVFAIFTPSDFDRVSLIRSTIEKFGISQSMLENSNVKVRFSDTEESITKRVLKKYQDEIVQETSEIIDLKQELLALDPREVEFRDKVNELSWKYTSSLQKIDMANLSQLVVRRSSILEVLDRAIEMVLTCQNDGTNRNENERIIHNIFFPTGKDSSTFTDHDIWILNEEYHYFDHIASDRALSVIPWGDDENLFEPDIDASLEELFKINNEDHSLKRPDIAIFNEEGAAIIIELKAPDVELQEHILDLAQYARLLAAKSHGRINKFYGYLIGNSLDESRMAPNYTRFPSGLGYFSTDRISDPATGTPYGELYSEVLFYHQFVDRAKKRLGVYKEKLQVDF